MKEFKGAIIFFAGVVFGHVTGMAHGAAIQKTIDNKATTPANLTVIDGDKT